MDSKKTIIKQNGTMDKVVMPIEKEHKIRAVNLTFLATVFVSVFASSFVWVICKGLDKITNGFGEKILNVLTTDYFVTLLFSQVMLFLPAFIFIITNREYFFRNLRIKKLKLKTYGLIAAFGFFFIPIIGFVNSISLLFTKNEMAQSITDVVTHHSLVSSLIVIAIIPCILEETVYRGVFYNEYSRVNPLKAMLLSALLFGLLHMNLNQFMYAAVGGVVFAIMVEATGSITSSVIMHFMINAFSTIVSYFSSDIVESSSNELEMDITTGQSVQGFDGVFSFMNNLNPVQQAVVSIGVIACICIVFEIVILIQILITENRMGYFKGLFRKKRNESGVPIEDDKQVMVTPTLVIAMLMCVIVIFIRHFLG